MAAFYFKKTPIRKILVVVILFIILSTIVIFRKMESAKKEEGNYSGLENPGAVFGEKYKSKYKGKVERLDSNRYPPDFSENRKPAGMNVLKIFHLDLKGAPPKMDYLLSVIPVINKAGANGILIEYEDMFPFSGRLKNVSAANGYTKEEVKKFVQVLESLKMEVIPLVQTFGHLEFVLKLKEFQHLRELNPFPQELCPSKTESLDLIKEMIRQIMEMHPNSKYLHIGCDEVYHLGACPICSRNNPKTIFVKHVKKVGNYVRNAYPGVTPLIWDDMLRHWPLIDLEESQLGAVVEPVIWVYIEDIFRLVPHYVWHSYTRTFSKLWAASAFKGAFGETEIVPDISRHFENNLAWIKFMKSHHDGIDVTPDSFGGIFLTGWSRYDHFAVLSELLPIGIPSLILNLILVNYNFNETVRDSTNTDPFVFRTWFQILHCPTDFPAADMRAVSNQFHRMLGSCSFPGSNLYSAISEYYVLKSRLNNLVGQIETNGWVSKYNIKNNYTSPWRVMQLFTVEGFAGEKLEKDILQFKNFISTIMTQYYDNYTISEWIEQKITPMKEKINEIQKDFQGLLQRKDWPRRPLPIAT